MRCSSYSSAVEIAAAARLLSARAVATSGDSNSVLDAATSHALGRGVPRLHDAVQVLADDRVVRGGDDRSESVRVSVRHERKDLTLHAAEGRSEDRAGAVTVAELASACASAVHGCCCRIRHCAGTPRRNQPQNDRGSSVVLKLRTSTGVWRSVSLPAPPARPRATTPSAYCAGPSAETRRRSSASWD